MYIYNIGYHTYEESESVQLYHEKKYTKEEFESITTEAVGRVLKAVSKDKVTFQSILFDVVEELTKNFGFTRVKFTSEFNVFGWADILDGKDWEDDRDEQLKTLTDNLKKKNSATPS